MRVPSGKITSCRPSFTSAAARFSVLISERGPPPRSTEIMPTFFRYQPNTGIIISSRLRMNSGCSKKRTSANVSQNDWCLEATTSGPAGIFSTPRNSIRMLQITRIRNRLVLAHAASIAISAPRGSSSAGSATMQSSTSTR